MQFVADQKVEIECTEQLSFTYIRTLKTSCREASKRCQTKALSLKTNHNIKQEDNQIRTKEKQEDA